MGTSALVRCRRISGAQFRVVRHAYRCAIQEKRPPPPRHWCATRYELLQHVVKGLLHDLQRQFLPGVVIRSGIAGNEGLFAIRRGLQALARFGPETIGQAAHQLHYGVFHGPATLQPLHDHQPQHHGVVVEAIVLTKRSLALLGLGLPGLIRSRLHNRFEANLLQ